MSLITIGISVAAVAVAFLVIVVPVVLAKLYRTVVEPNEVHIVQSNKSTISYGKGYDAGNSYFAWPSWWPVIGIQTVVRPLSVFSEELNNYEAYDIGRVPFVVDIKAFFRIANPNMSAERVQTMEKLREQLKAILQGAVRSILANEEIEEILGERSKYGMLFTKEVEEQLKEWGVDNVKNIELMDIRDAKGSKTITNIQAKKESQIEKESRVAVAGNIKDAEIAEINAIRERDVTAQEAKQLVGQRTAKKDQEIGIADELAKQAINAQGKITAETEMAVNQVNEVKSAEIAKQVRLVKADEQRQVDITETEGKKQETILMAEGNLVEQEKKAAGILAVGESEAQSKKLAEMAVVDPQIALATEIGENQGYQTYLIEIRGVEKDEAVGIEQAKALQDAGIKVIANSGDVTTGVSNVMDLFSSKGGTAASAAVEAFAQTPAGEAIVAKFLGAPAPDATVPTNGAAH